MVVECDQEEELCSDEYVVATYLLKLLDLSIDSITRIDMWHLLSLYSIMNLECTMDNIKSDNEVDEEEFQEVTSSMMAKHERYLAERQSENEALSHTRTPVICYRCHKEGHIAKGCREFKCFRCREVSLATRPLFFYFFYF